MSARPPAPRRLVVDASVGIKLFLREPLSEHAAALFAQLAATPPARFYVPDLFFIECANILWKYVRRFGYPAAQARRAARDLQRLNLRSVSTAELLPDALRLGLAHNQTAYDACYLALARRLRCPFVTADERLARALAGAKLDVRWLGAEPPPPAD